jgi:protein-S-isoprenylcysteine O-methyltransferase Ste14
MFGYVLIACWTALAAYWFVASFGVKKAAETQGTRSIFRFRVMQVANFVLLAGVLPYRPFNLILWHSAGASLIGAVSCSLGTVLAIWARKTLAANWSSSVTFKEHHELITHGPYRFVRHPIYTGLLLMMLGTALVLGRLDCLVALISRGVLYIFKMRREESVMREHFPNQYSAYQARTGALLPWPDNDSDSRDSRIASTKSRNSIT